jgi:hypothetical protein
MKIPMGKEFWGPTLSPALDNFWPENGVFSKIVPGFQNFGINSEGLGKMFEGDFTGICVENFMLVSIEGLVCVDKGARTPIGAS